MAIFPSRKVNGMRRVAAALALTISLALPATGLASVPVGRGLLPPRRLATVEVNGVPVIRVVTPDGFRSVEARAGVIDDRLLRWEEAGPLNAVEIGVRSLGRIAVVTYGGHILATADQQSAKLLHTTPLALAARWADNLSKALGHPTYPEWLIAERPSFSGLASWYGPGFADRRTADGEIFDPELYTAASRWLPFDSIVAVTDLRTGRSVLVRVNDRGPYVGDRVLDLSWASATAIGLQGVDPVRCLVVAEPHHFD